jgi:hypothetical protein
MPQREKRPSRLAWFAMDADAFLDDPRMQSLTNREKSFWAQMLIRSFRSAGTVMTNPVIFAEQTGATVKEAKELIVKLLTEKLLIPTNKVYVANSPRMQKEHATAAEAYARFAELGKAGGLKRAALALVKK